MESEKIFMWIDSRDTNFSAWQIIFDKKDSVKKL
jgi:hypothetical protein